MLKEGFNVRVPLYRRIADRLRREIMEGGKPGDRFASQNEIAFRLNVAPGTAREAVALLVQEGLLERRQGSGTYVRERGTSRAVGIICELDLSHPATSPFFVHLVQRLRTHFAQVGFGTRTYIGHAPPYGGEVPNRLSSAEFFLDLERGELLGVVDVGSPSGLVAAAIGNRSIPLIHGGVVDGVPFVDYEELVQKGVEVLRLRGCRRLACVDLGRPGTPSSRLAAFEREVQRQGLRTFPAWQVVVERRADGGEEVRESFRRLWTARQIKPDGLLVLDDMVYLDLAPALIEWEITVPEELVIASHANRAEPRIPVPVPIRLAVDPDDVASAVVHNFVRRLKDPAAPVEQLPVPIYVMKPEERAFRHAPRQTVACKAGK